MTAFTSFHLLKAMSLCVVVCSVLFLSLGSCVKVSFVNHHDKPISIYWDTYGHQENSIGLQYMDTVQPGKTHTVNTHPSHYFELRESSTFRILDQIQAPKFDYFFQVLSYHLCGLFDDYNGPALFPALVQCPVDVWSEYKYFEQVAMPLYRSKQYVHCTEEVARQRAKNEERRHWLNRVQPTKTPMYTPFGYEKRKLPKRAWDALRGFWDSNRHRLSVERWNPVDNHVNWWEAPSYVLYIPREIELILREEIRPILEKWIGGKDLVFSAFYGIRVYTNNSILLNHVDRGSTHAVSAIIQVDQKVNEDWLLEVWGNDGKINHLKLEPGEIALYESARLVHGREVPLNGDYFANCFIHFKPLDWNVPAL